MFLIGRASAVGARSSREIPAGHEHHIRNPQAGPSRSERCPIGGSRPCPGNRDERSRACRDSSRYRIETAQRSRAGQVSRSMVLADADAAWRSYLAGRRAGRGSLGAAGTSRCPAIDRRPPGGDRQGAWPDTCHSQRRAHGRGGRDVARSIFRVAALRGAADEPRARRVVLAQTRRVSPARARPSKLPIDSRRLSGSPPTSPATRPTALPSAPLGFDREAIERVAPLRPSGRRGKSMSAARAHASCKYHSDLQRWN